MQPLLRELRLTLANWLRRVKAPILLIANKADNDRRENDRWEFMALGIGEPIPVSALHGRRAGADHLLHRARRGGQPELV